MTIPINTIDEIHGIANADGSFEVEIQTWTTDKNGNQLCTWIKIPRAEINLTALNDDDASASVYSITLENEK